ncbi:esterase [Planctomycetaceae bacterium SCGC AG-212-F19]|nr:esterase [Planctomycetaceae bacterium SCGC AG-212-F19]
MLARTCFLTGVALTAVILACIPAGAADDETPTPVGWKKTVISKAFLAEGVAVADVNKDGKLDILVGDVWFEAPDWKRHEIRKPGNYGDGSGGYSQCFACWAEDVNGDGWPDLIVIGFPGAPCHWYENPQGKDGHWKQHFICKSACNETPQFVDLFGNGKKVLVMGYEQKQIVWVAPGKDPTQPWEVHSISDPTKKAAGSAQYDHGLGVGDINGDGKLDVIVTGGWYEQPAKDDGTTPWKFHPANLGGACADMFALDIDGDGKADVISSSAHNFGIWAYLQKPGKDGEPTFVKQDLFPKLFSQSHAMHLVDINGDGLKDLVTGKRFWAHGPKGDAAPSDPAVLYWFEAKKSSDGVIKFLPHKIDDDSGIGTQFWVGDFNGDKLPDIVVANKKGVFLFEQVRK